MQGEGLQLYVNLCNGKSLTLQSQSNDGKGTPKFLAQFPAACPWVTSVGGTWHMEPEEAVFFSSGGFSEKFPMPQYQATQ